MENPHRKKNWNDKYLVSMKYQSFKREQYSIEIIDGKTYILAYNNDKKEGFIPNSNFIYNKVMKKIEDDEKKGKKKLDIDLGKEIDKFYTDNYIYDSEKTIYKGWSIFDSLLDLRQHLHYSYEINEKSISEKQLIDLETNLPKEDRKKVLKWCRKYGMPFLGDKTNNIEGIIGPISFNYGFKNDISTCIRKNRCICRLSTFLIGLNILYKTLSNYIIYLCKKGNSWDFVNIEYANELAESEDYDIFDIKSYIKQALISISDKAIINFENIIEENSPPHFESYAETIISLAMYQLAIIMSSKKIYTIKHCQHSECGNLFIPTRTTRNYCMSCSRQEAWKSRKDPKNKKHKNSNIKKRL